MIITDTCRKAVEGRGGSRQRREGSGYCANETLKLADAALARSLNEIAKFLCLFYAQGKLQKSAKKSKGNRGKSQEKENDDAAACQGEGEEGARERGARFWGE